MSKSSALWKVRREVRRLGSQLAELPSNLASLFFSSVYYDAVHAKRIKITQGDVDFAPKVAVYLIYPKTGLLASHLHALRWMVANGVAPLVVSNLPLDESDLAQLRPLAWRILKRPNIGYDFGGYRDGVLHLTDRLPDLQRLLLMNDSAWFPLPGARNWLEDAAALDVDYVGAATNYGMPRIEPDRYMEQRWSYQSSHPNFHYTSYALAIGPRILRDPEFRRFWQRFPLSDKKKRTVRRGEIGLSQWVIRRRYSHAATLDISDLDKDLADFPHDRLLALAQDIMIPEDPRLEALKARVLSGAPNAETLIKFILMATARMGMSYALQAYTIRERGFPFLKKSPLWLNPEASDISLSIASEFPGEVGQMIQTEAAALATHGKKPK